MKKISFILCAVLFTAFSLVGFSACSSDDDSKNTEEYNGVIVNKSKDTAMLLVTFGSTFEAPHETYKNMRSQFATAFPNADQYFSFTSTTCITRWAQQTGEWYATPDKWLEKLGEAGYKTIQIQSLHVIPGEEYALLRDYYVKNFKKEYPDVDVVLGEPLLSDIGEGKNFGADVKAVGDVLLADYATQLANGESLVLMGHGNPEDSYSYANRSYHMIEDYLRSINSNVFVGTVDCMNMLYPYVKAELDAQYLESRAAATKVVNLAPLMSIAGDHANNDMAGEEDPNEGAEDQSWKVMLNASGTYKVEASNCHLKGLGDYPAVVNVWINHMKAAIAAGSGE